MLGNNILAAGPPGEITLAKRGDVNLMYTPLTTCVKPVGDKGILANPIIVKEYVVIDIMRYRFMGISDTERGSTEVGFENHLEPVKFGFLTHHVEIKRK